MSGRRVSFEKWEGLGNDFVVVEEDAALWSDAEVRAVCDRRRGVGADGVLFVELADFVDFVERGAGTERVGDGGERMPRMVVRNADGSRPEMCGNGIRCVAGYLASRGLIGAGSLAAGGPAGADPGAATLDEEEARVMARLAGVRRGLVAGRVTIATDAGAKGCEVLGQSHEGYAVAVAMGEVRVGGELRAEIEGERHAFTTVDVGNPHAITFERFDEAGIERVGPRVARLPAEGTNVEFCEVVRGAGGGVARIDVVVWERGVGRTQACGTGACAVAAAACAAGIAEAGANVTVRLPGGELGIVITEGGEGRMSARMTGPARRVFAGELEVG